MPVELVGPFVERKWYVCVDGFQIPRVKVCLRGDDEDGPNWTLILDNRFATEYVTKEEIRRWAPILGDMGAIFGGWSCHGENSVPLNEFHCEMIGLGSDEAASMQRESIRLVDPEEG